MADRSTWDAEARSAFREARDERGLGVAVIKLHRKVDEVIDATIRGHGVKVACTRGCSFCCSLEVQVQPYEAFTLAAWLRKHFSAERLAATIERLRENAARTRAMGEAARKRANIACALLGDDGACTAYEARPAQCRRFHSLDVNVCKSSYADPADDTISAPMHAAVAHNAAVIVTQGRHAAREAGLDDSSVDMNIALLEALENPKALRRWRAGKKAFVNSGA